MGRRKKVLTDTELEYCRKSANRVKALKNEKHITYKELADSLGIAEATVRNYAHQRSRMSASVARLFQELTGIISPYWTGEADCKAWDEFQMDQFEAACDAYAEIQEAEQLQAERFCALFDICGFRYENLSLIPAYEFGEQLSGSHRITSKSTPDITADLNDTELKAIITRLSAEIELECFLKAKKAKSSALLI